MTFGAGGGHGKTLMGVAGLEGMDRACVSRMVNLTMLASGIVVAILNETLLSEVTLHDLTGGYATVVGGSVGTAKCQCLT